MTAPRTLDDAIAVLPGLRRFRQISCDDLRRLLDRQKGECTWCGGEVKKPRRTWCSDACVSAFALRCDPKAIRSFIEQRDHEICHYCGCDCRKLRRVLRSMRGVLEGWGRSTAEQLRYREWYREFRELVGTGDWEAHHLDPVIEGGGLCSPDRLVTACLPCHKAQTKTLAKKRAR